MVRAHPLAEVDLEVPRGAVAADLHRAALMQRQRTAAALDELLGALVHDALATLLVTLSIPLPLGAS